jgi:hypothetical protein
MGASVTGSCGRVTEPQVMVTLWRSLPSRPSHGAQPRKAAGGTLILRRTAGVAPPVSRSLLWRSEDPPRLLCVLAKDDKQRSVSAPDGGLLAAKSERVRLPNTSPNFRARALSWPVCGLGV